MDSTGPEFDLPCPSGSDVAALPLYMQRLAEEIEADHIDLRARISAAYRPKTAIWRRSVAAIASGGTTSFSFGTGDLVFYNYVDPVSGGPPFLNEFGAACPQAGMWELGWYSNPAPTGAFTAGSLRLMFVGVGRRDPVGSGVTLIADASRYMVTTQVAGGDHMCSSAAFLVPFDFDRVSVAFKFQHTNAASTVALTTVTAWVRYVGTGDPIEVVS